MKTNGKGIRYSPDQREAVFEKMGEMGYFRKEVERIMKKYTAKELRQIYRNQQLESSLPVDRKNTANIFRLLSKAILAAKRLAEDNLSDEMKLDIKTKQYQQNESKRAHMLNDIERLRKLNNP
jgi:predicted ABC-class ATPase